MSFIPKWIQLDDNRVHYTHPSGFIVVAPVGEKSRPPVCCALCQVLMTSAEDASAWRSFECCAYCARVWAEPDRKRWISGWRPTDEQIVEFRDKRLAIPLNFTMEAFDLA